MHGLKKKLTEWEGIPVAVLLTHGHFDHMLAADDLQDRLYSIPIIACAAEQQVLTDSRICPEAGQVHMSCWQISGSAMEKLELVIFHQSFPYTGTYSGKL